MIVSPASDLPANLFNYFAKQMLFPSLQYECGNYGINTAPPG